MMQYLKVLGFTIDADLLIRWIETIGCLVTIIFCFVLCYDSLRTYMQFYHKLLMDTLDVYVARCKNNLFKPEDFFYMQDQEEDLCNDIGAIPFINYAAGCSIFIKQSNIRQHWW